MGRHRAATQRAGEADRGLRRKGALALSDGLRYFIHENEILISSFGDIRMVDPRNTTDDEWVSVGAYPDVESAQVVSGLLTVEGVQNRLIAREPGGPLFGELGEWSVLVPPESVEAAERILAEPPPTDAELTALALKDPPPDDFDDESGR